MLSEQALIFEQYVFSKRRHHNLISEQKMCVSCGKLLTESELKDVTGKKKAERTEEGEAVSCELRTKQGKANGYIIHEDNAKKLVCIATGFNNPSANIKTGPMVQIFIIHSEINPVRALKTGADAVVCADCPHRPSTGGSCYVDVSKSVLGVYHAYQQGMYDYMDFSEKSVPGAMDSGKTYSRYGDASVRYTEYMKNSDMESSRRKNVASINEFKGKRVRFGAYGDPVNIPIETVRRIASVCDSHTGYTHQWRDVSSDYAEFFMASSDNLEDYIDANKAGWRTFRVSGSWDIQKEQELGGRRVKEVVCENSIADKSCLDCHLCDGRTESRGKKDNILIKVHGVKGKVSKFIEQFGETGDNSVTFDPKKDVNPELDRSQQASVNAMHKKEERETTDAFKKRLERETHLKQFINPAERATAAKEYDDQQKASQSVIDKEKAKEQKQGMLRIGSVPLKSKRILRRIKSKSAKRLNSEMESDF